MISVSRGFRGFNYSGIRQCARVFDGPWGLGVRGLDLRESYQAFGRLDNFSFSTYGGPEE